MRNIVAESLEAVHTHTHIMFSKKTNTNHRKKQSFLCLFCVGNAL